MISHEGDKLIRLEAAGMRDSGRGTQPLSISPALSRHSYLQERNEKIGQQGGPDLPLPSVNFLMGEEKRAKKLVLSVKSNARASDFIVLRYLQGVYMWTLSRFPPLSRLSDLLELQCLSISPALSLL